MKYIAIISISLLLSACQFTQQSAGPDSTIPQTNQVAESTGVKNDIFACDATDNTSNENQTTCSVEHSQPQEGVAALIHPLNDIAIRIPLVPEAKVDEEESETNLWQRISSQFTFDIPEAQPRLDAQKKWFLRHPAYMGRVSKRASPFLYYITERLEQENMPMELALLPIVESAFDPFAYSHGRASGMWQFIPSTGKRFGMKQTWWYDGRRDVIASTEGAIKYLKYLHKMFDGDWLHALAAYNSGEGRVMRAIRKNKKAGKATDFWSLALPKETRAYVPKLLALSKILSDKEKYNFAWPIIPNTPVVEIVDVGSQIDLALAAKMAGLSIGELQGLNPGFNRWATDPDGPHTLLLPLDKTENFKQVLAKTSSKDRLNWVRHQVKSGDSLGVIAQKYSSSIKVIQQVNNMKGNRIIIGDYLLVPVSLKQLDEYSLSADQRLAKIQSIERAEHKIVHKVSTGDTLWDIAMAHKVGVRDLAKWNKMAPGDTLKIDADIVVWTNNVPTPNANAPIVRNITYTVRSGDSLARIAGKFKVSISEIKKWNKLNKNKYLQPGQKLRIKVDVTET
ncbi:LysM peptidoglycan-binding domain-containing protein [Glaciecola petra]|uniref:LysM peptidoglycan-binding domain-containing protein n=1 Tax=Glaciecola petra TaxID=3075602 RepID=A0ABU2ZQ73_9ALTE|nr:LysM peptidoglycan-binding domain-containing protein [Aestuariibacter sp. P117]MDT0594560.1 LysM peptidoglycan-binding domain-containing protein [Aestuariibacter sp. P117]